MKIKKLINVGIGVLLSVIYTSCIGVDENEQSYADEMSKLNQYITGLESEGYDVDTTALGVYYITLEEGDGEFPVFGDTLTVTYSGYLIDGTWFDTSEYSETDTTWTFELGDEGIISGWNDGMKVIDKGGKAQLMVPSNLAYGETGYSSIPPNNSLIFVVKMVDIKQQ
ncbi:FKBP-type peptidyl-prolyl cis-trans isomerase [Maribellus comscasis]|nr:FKBP-type peptidyl-prolyl cis-trans isomerase [Maribellus comscasis]